MTTPSDSDHESPQASNEAAESTSVTIDRAVSSNPSALSVEAKKTTPTWRLGLNAIISLYLFLSAINILGAGLKTFQKSSDFMERIFQLGENPILALMGGVIATAIVQSSSVTTSIIIGLVAYDQMELSTAIFAVMGANVGTSITNNLVSLGTVRFKRQFRRAYTAALMHGNVNLLTVAILFPLEWITGAMHVDGLGWLTRFSVWLSDLLGMKPISSGSSPVKFMTKPVVDAVEWFGGLVTTTTFWEGLLVAGIGLITIFITLGLLVMNLKGALLSRIEGLFSSHLFRTDLRAGMVGMFSTFMVQSSSVTTSLMVPLAGAGAVKLNRVFPFMLGCNIGTTLTGVLAASANPAAAAVAVAICHVLFNVIGCVMWYPARALPMGFAHWYARLAAKSKWYYFLYIFVVFVLIPCLAYFVSMLFV
ncbi:MAG: Na/Pi symporter [Planctomycetota bacterium]|nr:Na/Pi symporter [Planctomycetota bacterium]